MLQTSGGPWIRNSLRCAKTRQDIFSSNEFPILGDIGFLPCLQNSRQVPLCCLMKLSVYRVNEQSQISLSFGQKREGVLFLFCSELVHPL